MPVPVAPTVPRIAWRADSLPLGPKLRLSKPQLSLTALTLGRLSLVPVIVFSFMKIPALTTSAIVLFAVADIFDGVLARNQGADGPTRRAVDSAVDRIGIDAGMVAAYFAGILPGVILLALLIRDAYCAIICAHMVYRRNVAIKADWMYRALNLCVAAGAVAAPFLAEGLWVSLASALVLFSVVVAVDLTRSVRLVEASSPDIRDTVLEAGALRHGQIGK